MAGQDNSSATPAPLRFSSTGLERVVLSFAITVDQKILDSLASSHTRSKLISRLHAEGLLDEALALRFIASAHQIPLVDLSDPRLSVSEALARISNKLPEDFCILHRCIPIEMKGNELFAAFADPFDVDAIHELGYHTGSSIKVGVAKESEILATLYLPDTGVFPISNTEELNQYNAMSNDGTIAFELQPVEEIASELDDSSAPIVRLVNELLSEALKFETSDIHLEPSPRGLEVKYRIDGVIVTRSILQKDIQAPLISRVKILANMDITERRRPQDGRFSFRLEKGGQIDIRCATAPTPNGEKVVMRLLTGNDNKYLLNSLGLEEDFRQRLEGFLDLPDGILLVTGPTGSGKTTTLYSCLAHLRKSGRHIVTVEDPIEYRISGITQMQIDQKINMTFASGMRSILRQDPDIIFVGEIRDLETAKVAFNAAQTGHLVLSTLHTRDAASAVTRLRDLGLESFLISSSLRAVIAQRLVRKLCDKCKRPLQQGDEGFETLGNKFSFAPGCRNCSETGFRGRVGVYSLLTIDGPVRAAIQAEKNEQEIAQSARGLGYRSLPEAGLLLAKSGTTSVSELKRVLGAVDIQRSPTGQMPARSLSSPPITQPKSTGSKLEFVSHNTPGEKLALGESCEVLIIENDLRARANIAKALRAEQINVVEVGNSNEALEFLKSEIPKVILCDLEMPTPSGLDFLRTVKKVGQMAKIPVVILSGKEDEETEIQCINAGASEFLGKSSSMRKIVSRVRRFMME